MPPAREGITMKGNIYPTRYGYQVRFGEKLCKHFKTLELAERFLTGIRFKVDEGTFDIRDYKSNNPLGFANLIDKWLELKRKTIKPVSYGNIKREVYRAIKGWGNTNVKLLGFAELEDFIYSRDDISEKTRAHIKSYLHDFFKWIGDRYDIAMPKFPKVTFELGWRNITDIATQQAIISEIRRISYDINPKIWLGVKWLAIYISVRPGELIRIQEKDINRKAGFIVIPHPKEKQPKIIYLMEDDIELLRQFPTGLPNLYFFRHQKGNGSAAPGQRFGKDYCYKWWKVACKNLGIEGVDLYGGTRHSTTTALGKVCTPEEIQDATGHASKAFQRYFQDKQGRAVKTTQKIQSLSNQVLIKVSGDSENGKHLEFKEKNGAEGRT